MKKNILLKVKAGSIILMLLLAFFVTNIQPAKATMPVSEVASIPQIISDAKLTIKEKIAKVLKTVGAKLIGTTVRNTLNRLAMDAAKYVASAGEGQKPTYIVSELGGYWKNVGDAAAGDFIDSLGKDWGVDLCTPPSTDIQAKISLGLVQTVVPSAPDCTVTKLVTNYTSAYEKIAAMKTGDYFKAVQVNFDPTGSELGGALTLFGRTISTSTKAAETEKDKTLVNKGWLDVRNIAGKLKGAPGESEKNLDTARSIKAQSLLVSTGDVLVDAANTFLNQLAYEGFQRVMREISKGAKEDSAGFQVSQSSAYESLIQYGEALVTEKLTTFTKPRFDVRSDYDIISDLVSCLDKNNPGPTNCVIDDKFSQAISEKLTVGEALEKGYLHGDWLISGDNKSENTYTLRSAIILRKYRIIPVGWEQAFSEAIKSNNKITLQDLVSCFDSTNISQAWCRGLIDPNWVLKAPLNFCSKEGYGNQILSRLVSKDADGLSNLVISRADGYCADDKTCIKEKADGSCEVYGYCNEEKRTWKFETDSCQPVYNTCQTFTSASDKQTASFLENTLDYNTCDQNNSGCKQYSYNGTYSVASSSVNWDKDSLIYFNNKIKTCDASNDGCTELLRGKSGWANVNYVMNADFILDEIGDLSTSTTTDWFWPIDGGLGKIVNENGEKALLVTGNGRVALYSNSVENILPKNLTPLSGWSYTLSADVKLVSGTRIVMTLGDNDDQSEVSSSGFTTISVTAKDIKTLDFVIEAIGGSNVSFVIKNLNLTPNNYNPGFSNYGNFPVYEKLLPNYLESTCYKSTSGVSDYNLKDNAPEICSNYVRKCNLNEVGCELFTSIKDKFQVAAKANVDDYCDESCVGYDAYLAKESYFYGTSVDNLIPKETETCRAESVGCSSFTNLDAVNSGGENLEYYSKIRQCIKPDTAACGDFYYWDNSQLSKAMSLKKDASGNPAVVDKNLSALCNKEIYSLPINNPGYNPDCQQFYSKNGVITYQLLSNTISCSDSCYSYRLNEQDVDNKLNATTCVDSAGNDRTWDAADNACYVCKNGGVWNATQKACVYRAIPNEGKTCAAEEVGCREYNGNNGNSLKLKETYDFEVNTSGFTGSVSQSLESTVKNGHSLMINQEGKVDVSDFAVKDSAYIIKFIAKASSDSTAKIYFSNSKNEKAFFNTDKNNANGYITIKGGNVWRVYEINIGKLDHEILSESLVIENTKPIYIDNLIVNEITDKYYLIKGTSQVPDVCFYDISDVYRGPDYNLGCAAYSDRSGTIHNLYQFSDLCQNSAVGCEQLIQTNNSSLFRDYTINLNGANKRDVCTPGSKNCLEVKGAQAIYAVFDANKRCNLADNGCSRFGQLKTVGNTSSWVDTYKINLTKSYLDDLSSPLCRANEVGCDTWVATDGSASYFKNPGINACVFKNNSWYKMPVKRCDSNNNEKIDETEKNGAICFIDSDCANKKCITDTNDYPCKVTSLKTFGFGGVDNQIYTPDGAVGLCSAESSGCGEYIDPVSKYVNNLIYNPKAEKIDDIVADRWAASANNTYSQRVAIKPNKIYILQIDDNSSNQTVTLNNFSTTYNSSVNNYVRTLQENNNLSATTTLVSTNKSILFHSGNNNYVTVFRKSITTTSASAPSISLKEAIINYQLKTNINTSACNGVVNTDSGCVLFNARTQAGASGLKRNIFDANSTIEGKSPVACSDDNCVNSANLVIKVSPDRVCSRWLDCQTYTEDPKTNERTCYKIGECDRLNEQNQCSNFLPLNETVRDIKNTQNKNATGYALLNNWYIGGMKEVGTNTNAHFGFEDTSVTLTCKRNIDVASGSVLYNIRNSACVFDKNINDSLVLNPEKTTADYPAQGKGFLKVVNYYQISPQAENSYISIYTNQDYYINYLVNTKDSGARAKLVITDETGAVKKNTYSGQSLAIIDSAPNGWERKIYKFKLANANSADTSKKSAKIKIYLSSDTTNLNNGYVYFDDINIEPVLQTSADSYISKDCRLYPSDDSISCLSANNNVIKDGLYGYCLQYDPLNPKVCLMWYPIDKISPITRNNQSVLGYSGKFPLYYCTEANGAFDLVEKRVGSFHMWADSEHSGHDSDDWNWIKSNLGVNLDNYNNCSGQGITTIGKDCRCLVDSLQACGSNDYTAVYSSARIDNGNKDIVVALYCVPKQSSLLVKTQEKTIKLKSYIDSKYDDSKYEYYEGRMDCSFSFREGWGKYYDFLSHDFKSKVDGKTGADIDFDSTALTNIREADNAIGTDFDSVMVLEAGKSLESDLKYLSGSNTDQVFRISCNKFSKFAESDGTNKVWSGRISRSSIYSTTTPNFFDISFSGLKFFGRNREDIPFGAAALPSDYDLSLSEPLVLRNQYSKQLSETIFAGRPYGCTGDGCSNIGQCSLNPNVFCIYVNNGNSDLNKKGCSAGGNGSCIPLWSYVPNESNAFSVLNQIFMYKYGDFVYDTSPGSSGYINKSSAAIFRNTTVLGNQALNHNVPTPVSSIDGVKPQISNIYFKSSKGISLKNKVATPEAGLYQLSFNIKIDEEQQPLNQIIIDWGDSIQVVTGVDNKTEASDPHVFYHFYLKNASINNLSIKVIDNWDAYNSQLFQNSWVN